MYDAKDSPRTGLVRMIQVQATNCLHFLGKSLDVIVAHVSLTVVAGDVAVSGSRRDRPCHWSDRDCANGIQRADAAFRLLICGGE
jgi:hypothetical protein